MTDWIDDAARLALERLLPRLRRRFDGSDERWEMLVARIETHVGPLFRSLHALYGWRWDFAWVLESTLGTAVDAASKRAKWMRRRDDEGDGWLHDPRTTWAMAYTGRFCGSFSALPGTVDHLHSLGITHLHLMPPYAVPDGPDDGGYAVSDYRSTRSDLGTVDELRAAIRTLDQEGIGVVLDFVANHTADDHPWAEAAKRGQAPFRDFYLMFEDRDDAAGYLPHLREIFPDRGGDALTWRADVEAPGGGMWVWTTFYPFQWDLDYRNPDVLVAMARELLFVVNLGPRAVRIDATPFLWKQEGTSCENLPQAHEVIRILRALTDVAAPGVQFLSEAIVHPDEVARFVRPDECEIGYNPLVMALLWEAVATGDATFLADALARRSGLPPGCQWISYLRSHDDIGWGFADEDAERLGLDPADHRRFLNDFYSGEVDGSFAAGRRFQENPRTGDARISGTLASLAGLERAAAAAEPVLVDLAVRRILVMHAVMMTAVGIPLLNLGDEIGQLNDLTFLDDPDTAGDNRWMHRPRFDWVALVAAEEGVGPGAPILAGIRRIIDARTRFPSELGLPEIIETGDSAMLAFRRRGADGVTVLVVANLSGSRSAVAPSILASSDTEEGAGAHREPIRLEPYGFRILLHGE